MRSFNLRALVVAALLAACVVVALPPATVAQSAGPAVRSGQWVFVPDAAMLRATAQTVVPSGSGASVAGATAAPQAGGQSGALPPARQIRGVPWVELADGRILAIGGSPAAGGAGSRIDLFDSALDSWREVGALAEARAGHTVTALLDGRVVVVGGQGQAGPSASIEIIDLTNGAPATNAMLVSARTDHAAALLADGRILIVGGWDGSKALASAEIFDPATGTVVVTGPLATPRRGHSATTLLDGTVLVAGGSDGTADLATAELFEPARVATITGSVGDEGGGDLAGVKVRRQPGAATVQGAFVPVPSPMTSPRRGHLAARLPHNNTVLLVGGIASGEPLATAEHYVPWQGVFVPTGPLTRPRVGAVGAPLDDSSGWFVIVGGDGGGEPTAGAEAYRYATLETDKRDYGRGEAIGLSGRGWDPDETVDLVLQNDPMAAASGATAARADATGTIRNDDLAASEAEGVVPLVLTASGQSSSLQARAQAESGAGGEYTIKWYAADPAVDNAPYLPTYAKLSRLQKACPTRSNPPFGICRAFDPLENAVAYASPATPENLDAVTSLAPDSLALGQIVPFEVEVTVGSGAPSNGTISFVGGWNTHTTSGGDFGYDPTYGVYCAFVDLADPATPNNGSDINVDAYSGSVVGEGGTEEIQGTIVLEGLDPGDRVIVEIWAVLKPTISSGTTGNVQSRLISAQTSGGDTINVGQQTVPLLNVQGFLTEADVSVTKSDDADPVTPGSSLVYTIVVANNSMGTAAKGIKVTDTLDSHVSYVSAAGEAATCSHLAGVVTCGPFDLEAGDTETITLTVQLAADAPIGNDTSAGAAPGVAGTTCPSSGVDLCNLVVVSSGTDDPDPSNNSYYQPTNVVPTTSIATTANPSAAFVGTTLNDEAVVTGIQPAGKVTFTLYPPGDPQCGGTPVYSETVDVVLDTVDSTKGTATTALGYSGWADLPDEPPLGVWNWIASYEPNAGDTGNVPVASACGDEPVTISRFDSASYFETTQLPTEGATGTLLHDTATLGPDAAMPQTEPPPVTFTLYMTEDCSDFSAARPYAYRVVVSDWTETLEGQGTKIVQWDAVTPDYEVAADDPPGTWQWVASFTAPKDSPYTSAASGCGDEPVVIAKKSPTIGTQASPASGTVGAEERFGDTATLIGGYQPTGSVTFTLYSDDQCTVAAGLSGTGTIGVSGDPPAYSASFSGSWTPTAATTYFWIASYAGDDNNEGFTTKCGDANEMIVVAKATPTITTVASPTSGTLGVEGLFGDTATLAGGYNPTGDVTFTLYSDPACLTPAGLSGSGTITAGAASFSGNWTPTAAGTYTWIANYPGDSNNNDFTTTCTDANESIVVPKASPTVAAAASPVVGTVGVAGTFGSTATLAGGYNPGGDVTFTLYSDPTCTTTAGLGGLGTIAAGVASFSASWTPPAAGTYYWLASYGGDGNNDGSATTCGAAGATVVVSVAAPGTIVIRKDSVPNDPQDFTFTHDIPDCTFGPLDDDGDGTLPNTATCANVPAGLYHVTEGAVSGFDLTKLTCDDANSAGFLSTRSATIQLEAGETVTCTFTNTKRGKIIIGKTAKYGSGTFYFSRSGAWSGDFSIGPIARDATAYKTFDNLAPDKSYTVREKTLPSSWVFRSITCSILSPSSGGTSTWQIVSGERKVTIALKPGETVRCTYRNEEPTRSHAFWSTHYTIASDTWLLIPPNERKLCSVDTKNLARPNGDASNVPGVGMVPLTVQGMEGGFWSNIVRTTTKEKRSTLDAARMALVQQLLAAMLNVMMDTRMNGDAWDPGDPIFLESIQFINDAKAAYCGNDTKLILTRTGELFFFNNGGEKTELPPGMSPRAEPQKARKAAAEQYWDDLP